MNSRERIAAALEGQVVDPVPFCPFLAYVWDFFPESVRSRGPLAFHQMIGADPLWRGAPCAIRSEVPGLELVQQTEGLDTQHECRTPVGTLRWLYRRSEIGNTSFLLEHPLKRIEDYKIQMWIEEHTRMTVDLQPIREFMAGDGREGLSLGMLIPRYKSAFQSLVEQHVGTEALTYALADEPEVVESLWQAMVENDRTAVRLSMEAPYDYFITWEDSSTQNYSPAQYDRYIGPEIGEWCRILKKAGRRYIQHACGHVRELVERMRDSGVYGVESLSPPPTGNVTLQEARKRVGPGMAIIGGIEPVHFLNLSEMELGDYIAQVLTDGQGGPYLLANSDSCPPGVTVEKFKRVADVVRAGNLR